MGILLRKGEWVDVVGEEARTDIDVDIPGESPLFLNPVPLFIASCHSAMICPGRTALSDEIEPNEGIGY